MCAFIAIQVPLKIPAINYKLSSPKLKVVAAALCVGLILVTGCLRPQSTEVQEPSSPNTQSAIAAPTRSTAQPARESVAGPIADAEAIATPKAGVVVLGEGFELTIVEEGDTLEEIASLHSTTIQYLQILNDIGNSELIRVGQSLWTPATSSATLPGPAFEIIPDSELVYGPALESFDTQATVEELGGFILDYEEEVEGTMMSGPEIVQLVARRHSVSPRLLLAALEHNAGWLTNTSPAEVEFPMGRVDDSVTGLYAQLRWAASMLNWGFYGRADGGMTGFFLSGEVPVAFEEQVSFGTTGVQHFLGARDDMGLAQWLRDVGPDGLAATYWNLFGDPFAQAIEPLVPADLAQPEMSLPWGKGESYYFTGGPHAGWNHGTAWAALDFVPEDVLGGCQTSDSWLTAVTSGVIVHSDRGLVILDLQGDGFAGSGWAVIYMHLEDRDRIEVDREVEAGQRLGHPGCVGGFSQGTHLHLARTYNGRWISADGEIPFVVGGWRSTGEGIEYNGWLVRDGVQIEADAFLTDDNLLTAD